MKLSDGEIAATKGFKFSEMDWPLIVPRRLDV